MSLPSHVLFCKVDTLLDNPGLERMHWVGHAAILVLRQGISLVLGAPRVKKEAEDIIENWWHRID